jgi:hypothetical protein
MHHNSSFSQFTPVARRGLGNPKPVEDVTGKINSLSPVKPILSNYFGKKIPRRGFYNPITGELKTYSNPLMRAGTNIGYPERQFKSFELDGMSLSPQLRSSGNGQSRAQRTLFQTKVLFKGAAWKDTRGLLV